MHLSRFPRVKLAHLPTPLEPMKNLTKALGGRTFGLNGMIAPAWRPAATKRVSLSS